MIRSDNNIINHLALTLCSIVFFFLVIMPSTYAAAYPLPGNIATLTQTSGEISLSFSSNTYNTYFMEIELPVGSSVSNLYFGSSTSRRPVSQFDFISYAGNVLTVKFNIRPLDSSTYVYGFYSGNIDLTKANITSYAVYPITPAEMQTNPMYIYDEYVMTHGWYNSFSSASGINNTLSVSNSTNTYNVPQYTLQTTSGTVSGTTSTVPQSFLTSATLNDFGYSDTLTYVSSSQLVGSVYLTTAINSLLEQNDNYLNRLGTINRMNVNGVSLVPGDYYIPYQSSFSFNPSNGVLHTKGWLNNMEEYFTFLVGMDANITQVSLSGSGTVVDSSCDGSQAAVSVGITLNTSSGAMTEDIDLSDYTINLSLAPSGSPFVQFKYFYVGKSDMDTASQLAQDIDNQGFIRKRLDAISSGISNLLSGLTTSYNSDTSDALSDFDASESQLDQSMNQYTQAEDGLVNDSVPNPIPGGEAFSPVNDYVSNFNPDVTTLTDNNIISAFKLVGNVTNYMYQTSGPFMHVITFTLTLGCVLFVVGLRRQ